MVDALEAAAATEVEELPPRARRCGNSRGQGADRRAGRGGGGGAARRAEGGWPLRARRAPTAATPSRPTRCTDGAAARRGGLSALWKWMSEGDMLSKLRRKGGGGGGGVGGGVERAAAEPAEAADHRAAGGGRRRRRCEWRALSLFYSRATMALRREARRARPFFSGMSTTQKMAHSTSLCSFQRRMALAPVLLRCAQLSTTQMSLIPLCAHSREEVAHVLDARRIPVRDRPVRLLRSRLVVHPRVDGRLELVARVEDGALGSDSAGDSSCSGMSPAASRRTHAAPSNHSSMAALSSLREVKMVPCGGDSSTSTDGTRRTHFSPSNTCLE